MKINTRNMPYEEVLKLPRLQARKPRKPSRLLATVVRLASLPTLWKTNFSYTTERMELVGDKPCLILMNHSSFTDMKLAYAIFYPKRFGIVTSVDAMTGILGKLMRLLGCTPTHKYIADFSLIKNINYMLKTNKTSVLMYPEAGYSFDGRATTLPRRMGVLLKRLGVPVVTVITQGAFARDPLYNMLQIRDVKVSAHVKCIASAEEVKELTSEELEELDAAVEIAVQVNLDGICMIGSGQLTHDANGFRLTGADGQLEYQQSAVASHTLYSDYYWYEIGDVIGIGNNEFSYFCFPKANVSVTKARLATEELYKMKKKKRQYKNNFCAIINPYVIPYTDFVLLGDKL